MKVEPVKLRPACALWLCTLGLWVSPVQAQTVTLEQALRAARLNPDMQMAHQAVEAARGDVLAADHAPLPSFSAKTSSIDLENGIGGGNFFRNKRVDKAVGIDWTLERGGKRQHRTEAAQALLQASQSDQQDTLVQQLQATSAAFYDVLAAQEKLEHLQDIARSASEMARVAALRVKAGDLAAQDALRTDIEARKALADSDAARSEWRRSFSALALQMGRKDWLAPGAQPQRAQQIWPIAQVDGPAVLAALQASPEAQNAQESEWVKQAEQRADVRAASERLQAATQGLSLAQAQKTSDITWGMSWDHYPGTSRRLLELRMQMPLQLGLVGGYGFEGEIQRALAQQAQAQASYDKTLAVAMADIRQLWLDQQTTAARAWRYEQEVLPKARQVAANAELAYSKGAMSLTDLLDARRTLRATLLDVTAARTDHAKAHSAWSLRVQHPME